ncbi:MAG: MFS transporter [Chloroflexota bacterium]
MNKARFTSHIPIAAAYFLYWFAAASFIPYLSMYYESKGFVGKQIGLLIGIPYLVTSISSFLLGYLTDLLKKPVIMLRISSAVLCAALILLSNANNLLMTAFACLIYAISSAPINPILDEITLKNLIDPSQYGSVRIGGSFGWGLGVLGISFLLSDWNFSSMFYIPALLLILFLINTIFISDESGAGKQEKNSMGYIWAFIRKKPTIILLLANIVWGISESCITGYLFLHIKMLGGNSLMMGLSMALAILSEVICFSVVGKLLKRTRLSAFVIAAYLLQLTRLSSLAIIEDPSLLILFQFCGGASFALIWSATVAYINTNVDRELQATGQSLKSMVMNIGSSISVLLAGYIYEFYGSTRLYSCVAFIILIALITGIWLNKSLRRSIAGL